MILNVEEADCSRFESWASYFKCVIECETFFSGYELEDAGFSECEFASEGFEFVEDDSFVFEVDFEEDGLQ